VSLWEQAAACYAEAGALEDAARCYQQAGHHRQAAEYYRRCGQARLAAPLYEQAGDPNEAAWLLADVVGDPAEARACLARHPVDRPADPSGWSAPVLLHMLASGRCDLAEGGTRTAIPGVLEILDDVQQALVSGAPVNDLRVRDWAVEIATILKRFDQVALIFAAAVRGRRMRAAEAWQAWSHAHFDMAIVVPGLPGVTAAALTADHANS
jgi:hypothetical protein